MPLDVLHKATQGVTEGQVKGPSNLIVQDDDLYLAHIFDGISATKITTVALPSTGGLPRGQTVANGDLITIEVFFDKPAEVNVHDGLTSTIKNTFSLFAATEGFGPVYATFDGTNLILANGEDADRKIFVMDGISATVLSSFGSPGNARFSGLTYDSINGNLIIATTNTLDIFVMDGVSSTVLENFAAPKRKLCFAEDTGNLVVGGSTDFDEFSVFIQGGVSSTTLEEVVLTGLIDDLVELSTYRETTNVFLLDGTAVEGNRTLVAAGAVDGTEYPYRVEEEGVGWEVGKGMFRTGTPNYIERGTPLLSSEVDNSMVTFGAGAVLHVDLVGGLTNLKEAFGVN